DDDVAAFGAEVGRAVAIDAGFAVGVRQDGGSGASAGVVTLAADGTGARLFDLGRARGDFDAPLPAAITGGWLVGLLEPNASALTLRLALASAGKEPKWAAEIEQRR